MKHSTVGAPRKYTDDLVKKVRGWKNRTAFCADLGISRATFDYLRGRKSQHKKPSP